LGSTAIAAVHGKLRKIMTAFKLKDGLPANLIALRTDEVFRFIVCRLGLQLIGERILSEVLQLVPLLLGLPRLKLRHFPFKLPYALDQLNLLRSGREDLLLQLYNRCTAYNGIIHVPQASRCIKQGLECTKACEDFSHHDILQVQPSHLPPRASGRDDMLRPGLAEGVSGAYLHPTHQSLVFGPTGWVDDRDGRPRTAALPSCYFPELFSEFSPERVEAAQMTVGYTLGPNEGEHLVLRGGSIFIKADPSRGSDGITMVTQQVLAGVGIPIHRHLFMDETFYVLEGRGTVILDDVRHPIEKGGAIFIPKNTGHGFENAEHELVLLGTIVPTGLEAFFREIASPPGVPEKPRSKEQLNAIARKYGGEFR